MPGAARDPKPNRQIRSLVLCVDLVGSRRIPSDRLDDQTDDQGPSKRHGSGVPPFAVAPPGEGAAAPADQPAGGLSKVTQALGLACPAGGLWLPRPSRRAASGGKEQAMGGNQVSADPPPEGIVVGEDGVARCWWGAGDPLYRRYHDTEWGRPVAEDRRLFEKLALEGFQAGLSWLTILRKRAHFREVFSGFDPAAVARFGVQEVERLLADPGIVRNRAKIEATINNARRYAELATEFGSLAGYVWQYEPDPQSRPPLLDHATLLQFGQSPASVAMSNDLRRRGWSFVGPTTVYAFMEAMGLVNDHLEGCHRRPPVERERQRFRRPVIATGKRRDHPNTDRSPRR